jgi:CRP/FNR family transcriptional regulator, cyclic AMP receptor protein
MGISALKYRLACRSLGTRRAGRPPRQIQADLVDHVFNPGEKRLGRRLLLMAHFGKKEKPESVVLKVSQEALVEMIGTTRSRVSFFMKKFRKLGFGYFNGGLHVHCSLVNVVLHE